MASTADCEQALASLIRTISELLDVDTAGFMLYDPERSELVPALAPIAVGSHFGGYLAVWDGAAPLDEIDARGIEHAATIFALEMLHERTACELEARLEGDLTVELALKLNDLPRLSRSLSWQVRQRTGPPSPLTSPLSGASA